MKSLTKKNPIKQAINTLYQQEEQLSEHELTQLKKSIINSHRMTFYKKAPKNNAIIATACVLLISITFLVINPSPMTNGKTINIIHDVVDNHLLHKNLTYQTNSITELNSNFSYLGFLLSSQQENQPYGNLVGARPCFILNIPAAQLRYKKNNQWVTVFQTRYEENIYGYIPKKNNHAQPLVITQRGVQVNLWQENGLLIAVAQTQVH